MASDALPLRDLFFRARGLDEAKRRDLIADISTSDPELAGKLERMLLADQSASGPLDQLARPWKPEALVQGRYRIEKELKSGGLSRVFLARDEALHGRMVVAKFPALDGATEDWIVSQFRRESES